MRFATLDDGTRDGALFVVSPDGKRCLPAASVARSLQAALEHWERAEPDLRAIALRLERGEGAPLELGRARAPLPRAYEWLDGSAFLSHVILVRRARGAELPPRLREDPLLYQGGGGSFLGPNDPIPLLDAAFGLDFEAELGVVLTDTPCGVSADEALAHVALLVLLDDVTLRNLVPNELEKGFGFVQSKPQTAFAPFAITPDELAGDFRNGRVHRNVRTFRNDELVGDVDAREMHFSFGELVAHAARTRPVVAGTIVGSGTVSNEANERGVSCLVERRVRETLELGAPKTTYLADGEVVRIEVLDPDGRSVFGEFAQSVRATTHRNGGSR